MKFKAYFDVTTVANVPDTFIDDEMWVELEADSMERAGHLAFALFVKGFLVEAQPMPVCTKIKLTRVQQNGGNHEVKYFTQGEVALGTPAQPIGTCTDAHGGNKHGE